MKTWLPRLPLRFGPGLVLVAVAAFLLWRQLPPPAPAGTRVERTRVEATVDPSHSAPDPAWLLLQREQLSLSALQMKKLGQLRGRWERDTQELRAALHRVTSDFQQQMTSDGRQAITVAELQERARPVSELSRQLSVARRAWWEEAAGVLTASQRRAAEQAWKRRLTEPPDKRQQTQKRPVTAESNLYR